MSNHFGTVGFGHYTAYGKSVTDDKWYNFDDSCVSVCRQVVSANAYSLFYRLRGFTDHNNIDYEKIRKVPDADYMATAAKTSRC